MTSSPAIRVGVVAYLNSRPLAYRLGEHAPNVHVIYDLPSRLADRLQEGDLDVALIPSIEYFRRPGYTIVSDACVACEGPVRSVKLYARTPISEIRTLALDEGSRTSAALCRILLRERHGLEPTLTSLPIGDSIDDAVADAVLLIGDRCMQTPDDNYAEVLDLGEAWTRQTGLPFVFAMWVARPNVDLDGIDAILTRARDEGVRRLEEIAAFESPTLGISLASCLSYFRENLVFRLGESQRRGLEQFRRKAAEYGFIPSDRELVFHENGAGR